MRRLAITLAVTTTLALAAAAWAVAPKGGPFAGKTSLHKINGFNDLVTFTVSGKKLKRFTFGTLGCFAVGQFPVGTDPYGMPEATAVVRGAIPLGKTGSFELTTKPVLPAAGGTVTTAVIQGSFVDARSAVGTITISQSANGDTCGPRKMKFTAAPGTPSSLGIDG